jgi:hypothetical protein
MFVCQTCIQNYEGPSVDYVLKVAGGHGWGMSFGVCEFCYKVDGCFDLYSGDPNWYPKKKDEEDA